MRTEVSIPDPVFDAAEELAEELGVSRSELYTRALSELLREHLDRSVTERLNEVYRDEGSSDLDPELIRLRSASLERDAW